jgi:hypothetical protein
MFKKAFLLISVAGTVVNAQVITQNFGAGANAFSIDFVQIGNSGNAPDTTGSPNPAGSVSYIYNIGKYEVSRDMTDKAGIFGVGGFSSTANKPAAGITWHGAAMFVNYLNTSTGSAAAYKFDSQGMIQLWSSTDAGYNPNNLFRNSNAKYFLPSTDEWYKAAYGSPSGTWYNYPTGSDTAPTKVSGGTDGNSAVYGGGLYGAGFGLADITNAGGLSAWGTMAQGGNVWEWNETAFDGINDTASESRVLRGGSFFYSAETGLDSLHQSGGSPYTMAGYDYGFRVAMVPEPSALSLLAVGLSGLAMMRRRRS